ncbi:MAG: hypothetical protein RLN82_06260, partial [Pseudomonadales bacterium]
MTGNSQLYEYSKKEETYVRGQGHSESKITEEVKTGTSSFSVESFREHETDYDGTITILGGGEGESSSDYTTISDTIYSDVNYDAQFSKEIDNWLTRTVSKHKNVFSNERTSASVSYQLDQNDQKVWAGSKTNNIKTNINGDTSNRLHTPGSKLVSGPPVDTDGNGWVEYHTLEKSDGTDTTYFRLFTSDETYEMLAGGNFNLLDDQEYLEVKTTSISGKYEKRTSKETQKHSNRTIYVNIESINSDPATGKESSEIVRADGTVSRTNSNVKKPASNTYSKEVITNYTSGISEYHDETSRSVYKNSEILDEEYDALGALVSAKISFEHESDFLKSVVDYRIVPLMTDNYGPDPSNYGSQPEFFVDSETASSSEWVRSYIQHDNYRSNQEWDDNAQILTVTTEELHSLLYDYYFTSEAFFMVTGGSFSHNGYATVEQEAGGIFRSQGTAEYTVDA